MPVVADMAVGRLRLVRRRRAARAHTTLPSASSRLPQRLDTESISSRPRPPYEVGDTGAGEPRRRSRSWSRTATLIVSPCAAEQHGHRGPRVRDHVVDHLGDHDAGRAGQLRAVPPGARLGDQLAGAPGGADAPAPGPGSAGCRRPARRARRTRRPGSGHTGSPVECQSSGSPAARRARGARPASRRCPGPRRAARRPRPGRRAVSSATSTTTRLRLLGQHVEKRGPHALGGVGVEHPGQPDDRVRLSGVDQVAQPRSA